MYILFKQYIKNDKITKNKTVNYIPWHENCSTKKYNRIQKPI